MLIVVILIVVLLIVVKLSHSACDCHYVIMIVFMIVIMSCCSHYAVVIMLSVILLSVLAPHEEHLIACPYNRYESQERNSKLKMQSIKREKRYYKTRGKTVKNGGKRGEIEELEASLSSTITAT